MDHAYIDTADNLTHHKLTVLVVDDEAQFRQTLSERLELKGFLALAVSSGVEAIDIVKHRRVDLAIVDMRMPDMDGLVTIAKLKELAPGLRTLLLTGHGAEKLRQATEALDAAYFEKDDMARFWEFINHVRNEPGVYIIAPPTRDQGMSVEQMELIAARQVLDNRRSMAAMPEPPLAHPLIGQTPDMQKLKSDIAKVAALDCTVLILGETGTGKELVARNIHEQSPRSEARFLAVNCGSFSPELLSNELFGHERDAYTGARTRKKGVFEAASNGSILLDEIGDTPLAMQVQLLRVIQEKSVIRVGGAEEIPVDVRILAATNQSLKQKIEQGQFREDLYYRLNVVTLRIPPLRDRRDDIMPLCSFFLAKFNRAFGKQVERFDDEVVDILLNYAFPGNVRELENIVERAVILSEDWAVTRKNLPQRFQNSPTRLPAEQTEGFLTLAELEDRYIQKVLKALDGNRNEASKTLGISRASLWRKLKRMEEDNPK